MKYLIKIAANITRMCWAHDNFQYDCVYYTYKLRNKFNESSTHSEII